MSEIYNGGSAFPRVQSTAFLSDSCAMIETVGGMTLRDYFAGKALNGILRSEDGDNGEPPLNGRACDEYARQAYSLADAMLKERAKIGGAS